MNATPTRPSNKNQRQGAHVDIIMIIEHSVIYMPPYFFYMRLFMINYKSNRHLFHKLLRGN
jgi:hypothetical protein